MKDFNGNFKTFIEYYKKNEVILNESPLKLGRNYGDDLDNNWFNVENAKEVITTNEFITNETPLNTELSLYREPYDINKFMDYWVTKQPFIGCYYIFQNVIGNGIQSLGIWNHKQHKGSARELLFSYYLKKYSFIISDNKHTNQGEEFWKKIIDRAIAEKYKVNVITRSNKEFDIDDIDSYWGNTSEFSDYMIKIYEKRN